MKKTLRSYIEAEARRMYIKIYAPEERSDEALWWDTASYDDATKVLFRETALDILMDKELP